MKRMKSKGLVGFLMGCLICMLVALPCAVYADVTISGSETSVVVVDLEDLNVADSTRNAYVTSTGSVITGGDAALWAKVDGWTINVASGINPNVSGNLYGVIFNENPIGSGDWRSGTLMNYGGISGGWGVSMGSGSIYNYGSITGTAGDGIYMTGVGNKTITNSGTITGTGFNFGIIIEDSTGTVNITNSGTITGTGFSGIYVENTGTTNVTNSASGSITGTDMYGIYITNTGTATVTNSAGGNISGGIGGLLIRNEAATNTAIVYNYGEISSTTEDGGALFLSSNAEESTMTVYNYAGGVISGKSISSGLVSNSITANDVTNVYNYSEISSSAGDGICLRDGINTVTNYASGTITGSLNGIIGESNVTILNYGTITGTGGTAISLSRTNNQVTLGTGSVINGNIVATYGADSANAFFLDGQGTIGASQIQNFNTLNKTGAGTWKLTGDMDYTSGGQTMPITVEAGILAFGGAVKTNHFEQKAGASLGFVVTPTSSGTLTVVDVVPAETAVFNNGTIVVIPTAGKYAKQTTYLSVLDLSAATIDSYWSQVTGTGYLSPSLVETGENTKIYNLILNRLSFTTGAISSNNSSVGSVLDDMYDGATGDMRNILDQFLFVSPGNAQMTFTQMGGGTLNAFQFMSFYGLNQYHGALNNHLGGGGFTGGLGNGMAKNQYGYPQGMPMAFAAGGNTISDAAPMLLAMAGNGGQLASGINWDLWLDGYYSQGNRRADDIIAQYKQTLYGALMGFDYRATDNLLFGLSLGLSQTDVKFDNLQDKGRQNSYQGSVYTYYDGKPWYAEGVLTYGYNKYKMDRFITIGSISRLASSDYNGNEYSGYAEVGYKFDAGGVLEIRPLAAFQAAYLMQDSYTETGAGDLNLIVDSRNTGSYQSYLGLHINKAITIGNFVLTPDARAKWAHEFSDDNHLINAKFSSTGSGSFTIETDRPSHDTAIVGVGITGRFNKNLSAYIQYDAELNKDYTNHTGMMGLRFFW